MLLVSLSLSLSVCVFICAITQQPVRATKVGREAAVRSVTLNLANFSEVAK